MPEMYELNVMNLQHLEDLHRLYPQKPAALQSQYSNGSVPTTLSSEVSDSGDAAPQQHHPDYLMKSSLQNLLLSSSMIQREGLGDQECCHGEEQLKSHRNSQLEKLSDTGSSLGSGEQLYDSEDDLIYPPDLQFGLVHADVIQLNNGKIVWETHHIAVEKVAGLGFGVAVSGGKNNPHFTSGEPSIAISDVLKGGPADGKLKSNDRVLSINGISMEGAHHCEAIALLRASGNMVDLLIKRRVHIPSPHRRQEKTVAIDRALKDKELGMEVGCKFYVKNIQDGSPSATDGEIEKGDFIIKINDQPTDSLSLTQTQKLLSKARGKVCLTLERPPKPIKLSRPLSEGYSSAENIYQWTLEQQKHQEQLQQYSLGSGTTATSTTPSLTSTQCRRSRSSSKLTSSSEDNTRQVAYIKEGHSTGLDIAGGNHTGVYISSVEGGSPAQREGIREGDRILQINGVPVHNLTREQVVRRLDSLPEEVNLLLAERLEEYSRIFANSATDSGDEFYIRACFNYRPAQSSSGKLTIKFGDVFRVTDTFPAGCSGFWIATKMSADEEDLESGVIPSKATAHKLFGSNLTQSTNDLSNISKVDKFAGRAQWDGLTLDSSSLTSQKNSHGEVYEKVSYQEVDFARPVILYGALAELCREKLLSTYPDQFEAAAVGKLKSGFKSKLVLKVETIQEVINRGKHCVLDLPPHSIDKLIRGNLNPIVVRLTSDTADLKDNKLMDDIRKMDQLSEKIESSYPHLVSANIQIKRGQNWLRQVYDVILSAQEKPVWCTEHNMLSSKQDLTHSVSDYLSLGSSKIPSSRGDLSRAHYCSQPCLADRTSTLRSPSAAPTRIRSSTNPSRLTEEPTSHCTRQWQTSPLTRSKEELQKKSQDNGNWRRRQAMSDESINFKDDYPQYCNRAFVEDEGEDDGAHSFHRNDSKVDNITQRPAATTSSRPSSAIWFTDRSCFPSYGSYTNINRNKE